MRIKPQDIELHLTSGLPAVTLVEGEESLLAIEAGDTLRHHALELGYERRTLDVGAGFNWGELMEARSDLSLFATDTLLELRLAKGKLDAKAIKALMYYLEDPPPEKRLVILSPGLERGENNKAWVKQIDQMGWWVSAPKMFEKQFKNWIRDELNKRRLRLAPEGLELLTGLVEGNALAAKQEIEKLGLFATDEPMSAEQVAHVISDNARYTVFDLINACLLGNVPKTIRVCETLEAEGAEPIALMGMINRTLDQLTKIMDNGGNTSDQALSSAGVFGAGKDGIKAAMRRLNPNSLLALHQQASRTDRAIKGQSKTPAWLSLTQLALRIAGARTPAS